MIGSAMQRIAFAGLLAFGLACGEGNGFDWRSSATCPTSMAEDPVENDDDPAGLDCQAVVGAKSVVQGTVEGPDGEPIAEGSLAFVPDDEQDIGYGFENGRYRISLSPGLYQLSIEATGYREVTQAVDVDRNETTRLDFELPRNMAEPAPPLHRLVDGRSYWAVYFQANEGEWQDNKFASGYVGAYPIVRSIDCDDDARALLGLDSKKPFTIVANYFLDERSAELTAEPQDGEAQLQFDKVKVRGGRGCPLEGDY